MFDIRLFPLEEMGGIFINDITTVYIGGVECPIQLLIRKRIITQKILLQVF